MALAAYQAQNQVGIAIAKLGSLPNDRLDFVEHQHWRKEMKRILSAVVLAILVSPLVGCGETTEYKKETTVKTPGGTTTTTEKTEVEKSGENPPPAP
jgi:hypothetical protein